MIAIIIFFTGKLYGQYLAKTASYAEGGICFNYGEIFYVLQCMAKLPKKERLNAINLFEKGANLASAP